ncbi:2-oxoglutarate (2OG) and Fe(II)-dependent oxygenase superfamily protein [Striga asiatica]|uniref:2-oxoglutarate (2OG) and Fe(II)-dependent oxygenase superfamily protein n=1 Tax=Striga asiatica TaxID=4170 RepID=A0A5A7RDS3_STRAF|nr:2-oxoglutarate (2OG) and Fe(II)-dependent oxygenase superfamily protein [Striga asiatica]
MQRAVRKDPREDGVFEIVMDFKEKNNKKKEKRKKSSKHANEGRGRGGTATRLKRDGRRRTVVIRRQSLLSMRSQSSVCRGLLIGFSLTTAIDDEASNNYCAPPFITFEALESPFPLYLLLLIGDNYDIQRSYKKNHLLVDPLHGFLKNSQAEGLVRLVVVVDSFY